MILYSPEDRRLIYQLAYDTLLSIGRQITSHRQALAKPRIENLILEQIDPSVPNDKLLSHLIAESLLQRIDLQLLESKNIFVQEFDIPQTTLFYSMAEAVPFVYLGHSLANQYMLSVIENLKSFTIMDIGIGNGKQVGRLLEELKERDVETVKIIGLDPVEQNLENSREEINVIREHSPFDIEFYPICNMAENLEDGDFDEIRKIGGDSILINSAFSLHHTSHPLKDREARTNLFRRLAELQPLILTMVEPNSNHDTEELTKRLHHSWEHFGTVYALIDEWSIDDSHKFLIKEKFFGREIKDIFGTSDYFRCERHELYDSWLLRLHKAGFKPYEYSGVSVELPPCCRHNVSEGLVRFNYNDTTVVAVMACGL